MALIRRHPGTCSLLGFLVLVLSTLWLAWPHAHATAAGDEYPPLDPVAAAQLETLRRDAGLADDTLALANLSDPQLEGVLGGLRRWYEAHADDWNRQRTALCDARNLLALAEAALQNGQDETTRRNEARQQLAQARRDYDATLATLRDTLRETLSDDQRVLADRLFAQPDRPRPFALLDLTAEQYRQLDAARSRYYQRLAVAAADAARQEVLHDYQQDLATALGNDNLRVLDALADYLPAASTRVVAAVQLILPGQHAE